MSDEQECPCGECSECGAECDWYKEHHKEEDEKEE